MSITAEQKYLVQSSFAQVASMSEQVAEIFYNRLFELDPVLKPLFKGDIQEQGRKLMQMLRLAVTGLDQLDQLVGPVQKLGQRHLTYGVKPKDYDTVGVALLWTLKQGLGEAFTPQLEMAWIEVYTLLAGVMQHGAEIQA